RSCLTHVTSYRDDDENKKQYTHSHFGLLLPMLRSTLKTRVASSPRLFEHMGLHFSRSRYGDDRNVSLNFVAYSSTIPSISSTILNFKLTIVVRLSSAEARRSWEATS